MSTLARASPCSIIGVHVDPFVLIKLVALSFVLQTTFISSCLPPKVPLL